MHEYPLHRISYCADDKAEKRFFSFIAKDADSNKHTCFVFLSDKLAEEITLTIGQAFELAYKKYLESRGKEMESKKQSMIMTKRIEILEEENKELKKRLADVAKIKGDVDVKKYMKDNNIADLCTVALATSGSESPELLVEEDKIDNSESENPNSNSIPLSSSNQSGSELICLDESTSSQMDFGGITLDNFELDGFNDDDFDPRAEEAARSAVPPSTVPAILVASPTFPPALPPRAELNMKKTSPIPLAENNNNPFNNPFNTPPTSSGDPFGMASFASNQTPAITPTNLSKPDPFAALDDLDPFKNIQ